MDTSSHCAATSIEAGMLLEFATLHRRCTGARILRIHLICKAASRQKERWKVFRCCFFSVITGELTVPSELDDNVNFAIRLQVHPKILLIRTDCGQIGKVYGAIGDELIGRQRGIVKNGQTQTFGILQFVYEALVPARIERLWFGGGSI